MELIGILSGNVIVAYRIDVDAMTYFLETYHDNRQQNIKSLDGLTKYQELNNFIPKHVT